MVRVAEITFMLSEAWTEFVNGLMSVNQWKACEIFLVSFMWEVIGSVELSILPRGEKQKRNCCKGEFTCGRERVR